MSDHILRVMSVATTSELLGPTELRIRDGVIVDIKPTSEHCEAGILAPGFVDLQVNGTGPFDITDLDSEDWTSMSDLLLAHGVTTWCPTIISRKKSDYRGILDSIYSAMQRQGHHGHIAGVHLEGPFLAVAGAHPPDVLHPPDRAWLQSILDDYPGLVRIVTLAPELDGALETIRSLTAQGVIVSIGHTDCDHLTVEEAVQHGARMATHIFNAMTPIHHREPGAVPALLSNDEVICSVIADGHHVHPMMVNLVHRLKGREGTILVTDLVTTQGELHDHDVEIDDTDSRVKDRHGFKSSAPRMPEGQLAGGNTHMDAMIAFAVNSCGWDLTDAIYAATARPADLLNLHDRGRIELGARADLVLLDAHLCAQKTWIAEDWTARPITV